MRRSLFVIVCLGATTAAAQQAAAPPIFNLPDDQIRQIMQVARDNLHLAKLPDGSTVAPETAAEKGQALIPLASGRRVVEAGLLSGVAVKCGVDWKQSKMPQAISTEKAAVSATPKVSAYIEFLHGVAMTNAQQQTKECTPVLKDRVSKEIATRWK